MIASIQGFLDLVFLFLFDLDFFLFIFLVFFLSFTLFCDATLHFANKPLTSIHLKCIQG